MLPSTMTKRRRGNFSQAPENSTLVVAGIESAPDFDPPAWARKLSVPCADGGLQAGSR